MRFGHTIGVDLRQEVDAEGKVYNTLDILDFGARYSFYVLLPSKFPDDVAAQLAIQWVSLGRASRARGARLGHRIQERLPGHAGALERCTWRGPL